MKKVVMSFRMPHGEYCGGVASTINTYMEQGQFFKEENVQLELFDYNAPDFIECFPSKIRNFAYGFFQRRALLRKLQQDSVDAIHIHTSRQFLYLKDIWLAKEVKRKYNVPIYITVHVGAAETVFRRIGWIGNTTICWINQYVNKVFFLTDRIYKEFVNLGMESQKGIVLANFHALTEISLEDKLPTVSKLHLLFVGALHSEKGIIDLLTALTSISNVDFHLDICGTLTDQTIKEEFCEYISILGNRVTLHGYVGGTKKAALFHRADAVVLPSYHEGFPLVILEALAGGCAIISTPVGATPEILDEHNAIWVDVGKSKDICSAISKLSENSDLLEEMKQKNRELSKRFSIKKHIQTLCSIYNA